MYYLYSDLDTWSLEVQMVIKIEQYQRLYLPMESAEMLLPCYYKLPMISIWSHYSCHITIFNVLRSALLPVEVDIEFVMSTASFLLQQRLSMTTIAMLILHPLLISSIAICILVSITEWAVYTAWPHPLIASLNNCINQTKRSSLNYHVTLFFALQHW